MEVRQATRADLLEIARIAHSSLWAACDGLLPPSTITRTLEDEYSPSSLKRRLLSGGLVVAVEKAGDVVGFAEVYPGDDRVSVRIHSGENEARRSEWVRRAIQAVRETFPGRPVCADVMLGNLTAERSCEAAGFVPGEVIQRTLFGEPVVERRWWFPLPE